MKKPFVTKEKVEEIVQSFPTPFYVYDEKGIIENAKAVHDAFSWNKGYKEYFAVKATPNPVLMDLLMKQGCGFDCSSKTELMLSEAVGAKGSDIMFSSNDTPAEEYVYAEKLGAIINLDDFTHIDFLEKTIGKIPETISCRYNPGGVFQMSNGIMDNPGDSKYGMTKDQLFEAFKILKSKGAKNFGIHAFLASNTVTNESTIPDCDICVFSHPNSAAILRRIAFTFSCSAKGNAVDKNFTATLRKDCSSALTCRYYALECSIFELLL